jgi:hypothetical protein
MNITHEQTHLVDFIELGNDVESHFGEIIPKQLQEEIEEVLDSVFSAEDRCQTHNYRSEGSCVNTIRAKARVSACAARRGVKW